MRGVFLGTAQQSLKVEVELQRIGCVLRVERPPRHSAVSTHGSGIASQVALSVRGLTSAVTECAQARRVHGERAQPGFSRGGRFGGMRMPGREAIRPLREPHPREERDRVRGTARLSSPSDLDRTSRVCGQPAPQRDTSREWTRSQAEVRRRPGSRSPSQDGLGGAGGRPLCAGLTLTGGLPRAAAKAWLMRGRTPVLRVSRLWQGSIDVVVIAVKLPDKPDSDRLPDGYSSNVASSLTPRGSLYPDRATSSPATRRFCGKERHVARSSKSRLAPRGQVQNANLSRPGRHEGIPREVRERRLRSAPAGPLYGRRSAWPVPTATSTGHHSQQIGNTCRASVRAATWPVLDPRPARNT